MQNTKALFYTSLVFILLASTTLSGQILKPEIEYRHPVAAILLEEDIAYEKKDSLFWSQVIVKGKDTLTNVQDDLKVKIYRGAGNIMLHLLNADSALFFFEKAENLHNHSDIELAKLYISISDAWYQKMMYNKSSEFLFKALTLLENRKNEKLLGKCLSKIGRVLDYMERFEESITYFHRAIALQKKIGASHDLAKTYQGLSRTYLFVDSLDQAMKIIDLAIVNFQKIERDSIELHNSFNGKGNIFKYLENYDSAIHYYTLNLEYFTAQEDKGGIIIANTNLGHAYRLNEQYQTALPFSLKAIELANKTGETRLLWENNMHASIIYEMLGDFENSLKYNIVFANEREKLYEQNIENLKSEYQIVYETEKKDQAIETQQSELRSRKRIQNLSMGLLALLSLFLIGLFWVYQNNRKKNALLEAKNRENELLLKEIHHRVKNNLERISSLLYLQSASIEDQNALDAIQESQNRVHSISLIHKKLYTGKNLAAIEMQEYLTSLGESMLDTFSENEEKVNMKFNIERLELDVDTAVPIGLIVNELLTNTLKYAFPGDRKGEVQISLKQVDKKLRLQVKDNGIGEEISAKANGPKGTGFGGQLIQLLTSQLKGTMKKEGIAGTDTRFEFESFTLAQN